MSSLPTTKHHTMPIFLTLPITNTVPTTYSTPAIKTTNHSPISLILRLPSALLSLAHTIATATSIHEPRPSALCTGTLASPVGGMQCSVM